MVREEPRGPQGLRGASDQIGALRPFFLPEPKVFGCLQKAGVPQNSLLTFVIDEVTTIEWPRSDQMAHNPYMSALPPREVTQPNSSAFTAPLHPGLSKCGAQPREQVE